MKNVLHCSFNEEPCDDMYEFEVNEVLGDCITFNYRRDKKVHRHNSSDPGFGMNKNPWQGLRLVMAPFFSKQLDRLSPAKGYRVFIRKPQDDTYTVDEGFDANLGMVSYVGLKMMEFERLHPADGGDCALDSYLLDRFDPKIFAVASYAEVSSDAKWKEDHAHSSCGCPQIRCMTLERSLSSSQMGRHDALLIDLTAWMKNEMKNRSESELRNRTYCRHSKFAHKQMAVVQVFYDTMSVENTKEISLYPWSSFIGTFGGLLGLYTGMSFVSVLEMLEWILDILLYGWRKPRHDKLGPKRRAILMCEFICI
ncbi:unnamed protein product, partial [Darwinula stevensoni]